MKDVQSRQPDISKNVDKVGIRELLLPYTVSMKGGGIQHTIANVSAYVTLTSSFRGTHMSRIVQILHSYIDKSISSDFIDRVLQDLCNRLSAPSSYVKMRFPYLLKKKAPVSNTEGYMTYTCCFEGERVDGAVKHLLTVEVPYMSLCECSKEISDYNAHNQRSTAKITVMYRKENTVWIEDLIELVEKHASSPVYSILKREDEKYVTEHSYKHPTFVETMARRLYKDLQNDSRVLGFVVVVNHCESIHQHDAVAVIHGGYVYIP